MTKEHGTYANLSAIKRANKKAGHNWFSAGALDFFNSRIESEVYGSCYFVTSDQCDLDSPRLYSIRVAYADGRIDTVGDFQQYATRADALEAINRLTQENGE